MKFVGDRIEHAEYLEDENKYLVRIPQYHRVAVGLLSGTTVFVTPIMGQDEILLTTIDPKSWGDLWVLEMSLFEAEGSLKKIVDVLVENNVNILLEESLTERIQIVDKADHRVFFVIDLEKYQSKGDRNTHFRRLTENKSFKPVELISSIIHRTQSILNRNESNDSWRLNLERMEFFFNHETLARNTTVVTSHANRLKIPSDIMDHASPSTNSIKYHITSNSEEKYIKLSILDDNNSYLILSIEHFEEVGSIKKLCDSIAAFNINILNSYNRMTTMKEKAYWHCFLELKNGNYALEEPGFSEFLRSIIDTKIVVSFSIIDYEGFNFDILSVSRKFDKYYVEKRFSRKMKMADTEIDDAAPQKHRKKKTEKNLIDEEMRLNIKPYYRKMGYRKRLNTVFVAMSFSDDYKYFYENHIENNIIRCNGDPVRIDRTPPTRKDGGSLEYINEKIEREIASCSCMIGDITEWNANVAYELGLARALGKPIIVICSEEWKEKRGFLFDLGMHQHIFYGRFDLREFENKLQNYLNEVLSSDEDPPSFYGPPS